MSVLTVVINSQNKLDFIHKDLTIKDPPDFTVVSTFSGAGGSSTGYVWAGGKVLLAVEWDDNAVETYRLNYPNTDIYHGDIAKLTVDEVLQRIGLQSGELDILDGSPPCQGFSTAGKRQLDDERNQLFREYVRLLRGLQPKVFVMENVSGMIKGKMRLLFAEIIQELKASGYKVSARLLNAKYLGVPQSRERMIFIGVRDDLGIEPSHPEPQTQCITFKDAIIGLDIGPIERPLSDVILQYAAIHPKHKWTTVPQLYKTIKGNLGSSLNLKWAEYNKTIMTIIKDERALCGIVHPDRTRYLNTSELRRCGSFPDCYKFVGNRKNIINRIGNSVPPRMMQYIAEHIRDEILNNSAKR